MWTQQLRIAHAKKSDTKSQKRAKIVAAKQRAKESNAINQQYTKSPILF